MRALVACLLLVGCQRGQAFTKPEPGWERMMDQPRPDPCDDMRTPPKGTVPMGTPLDTGMANGQWLKDIPVQLGRADLEKGRTRFTIVCATCHGDLGDGKSYVASRMTLRRPKNLHDDDVRTMPAGQMFATISRGFGMMPALAPYLTVDERWAVVGYVRALQLSRRAPITSLPPDVRRELEEAAR